MNSGFSPAVETKPPHPLDIYYTNQGLHFDIACTGLDKKDINIDIEGNLLKIKYNKTSKEADYSGYIHKGLSQKSFNLGYQIAPKYQLDKTEAEMENGLLRIFIPISEKEKPKSLKIK